MLSICIATYNGAAVIATQLKSILPQLGENDEIIISDDASTDGTVEVIKTLGDQRIRIVDGPAKGNPIPNFENALREAKGDIIFLSDQDDQWLPGKVKASVAKLAEGYDCVVTDCIMTDLDYNVLAESFYACNHTKAGKYYNLLRKNGYLGGCMAFTRRLKERCLPFPAQIPMHDIWIGNVAAFFYKVAFINHSYSYFRRSGSNVSTSGAKSQSTLGQKIMYRVRMIRFLLQLGMKSM